MDINEPADVCLINTCTVTQKAESRCRNMIRRVIRISPNAFFIVAGCYAEMDADKLKKIDGIDLILGSDAKFSLFEHLDGLRKKSSPEVHLDSSNDCPKFLSPSSGHFFEHTRAFLKIQDGCDAFCSYCIVPYVRGRIRSGIPENICQQARELVDKGHREIVLTGAHIGCYGKDQTPPVNLVDLLIQLEKIDGLDRIRLSSIEPIEVTTRLIELMAYSKKICPHLHIPLQSGDPDILRAMNRHYSPKEYKMLIESATEKIPNIAIGTDVMVGFPGETQQQAENTFNLVQSLPVSYLHIFSYSVRKGTAAERLPARVTNDIKKLRSQRLQRLGKEKKIAFQRRFIGKILNVLFEQIDSDHAVTGLSENYIRVRICSDDLLTNQIKPVMIEKADGECVWGNLLPERHCSESSGKVVDSEIQ